MIPLFALLQGAATQTDALTRLLHQQQLTPWMIAAAIGIAFVLGAAHALTPGHGKTIVAAYLVGSRGTLKHAAFLGAMVTFTHTVSVFLLGLATLFLFQYVVPQKVTQVLGAISGISIVLIGGWMLYKRLRARHAHSHGHDRGHSHDHGHEQSHEHEDSAVHSHAHAHEHHHHHDHPHDHGHDHAHGHSHEHSHGPGGHTHMPDEISWSGLVALGASGGLVPCESALVLLLTAIALRRVGLGLLLLVSFSLGLALVLMAIGVLVIYAKNLLPSSSGGNPFFRWMPVASAAIVMGLGVVMTGVSLGWIRPQWMAG
ncbi:MAG: high frequency lysogenization protein HflD [Bryobacteraceae bacterium]|jgi:ABC-type nickel/cobalt efflux system permease component RcnA